MESFIFYNEESRAQAKAGDSTDQKKNAIQVNWKGNEIPLLDGWGSTAMSCFFVVKKEFYTKNGTDNRNDGHYHKDSQYL